MNTYFTPIRYFGAPIQTASQTSSVCLLDCDAAPNIIQLQYEQLEVDEQPQDAQTVDREFSEHVAEGSLITTTQCETF